MGLKEPEWNLKNLIGFMEQGRDQNTCHIQ